jgi:hypothetical protein
MIYNPLGCSQPPPHLDPKPPTFPLDRLFAPHPDPLVLPLTLLTCPVPESWSAGLSVPTQNDSHTSVKAEILEHERSEVGTHPSVQDLDGCLERLHRVPRPLDGR